MKYKVKLIRHYLIKNIILRFERKVLAHEKNHLIIWHSNADFKSSGARFG